MYEPNRTAIWPSVAPVSIVLWSGMYLRWVINQNDAKKSLIKIQNIIDYDKNLKSKVLKLRKELMDLQKEYEKLQVETGENNNPDSDSS
jgi:myotubularin-related protein 9